MKNKYELIDNGKVCKIYFKDKTFFLIDADDLEEVSKHSWNKGKRGYPVSTIRNFRGYKQRSWCLHTFLLNKSNFDIDHISGNKFDNRRCNLRLCTHQQNTFNQKMRCTNTSGFYGVSFFKQVGKYESYINLNGKKIHLGLYDTALEAAKVRDKAAIKYFGPFARLNKDLLNS